MKIDFIVRKSDDKIKQRKLAKPDFRLWTTNYELRFLKGIRTRRMIRQKKIRSCMTFLIRLLSFTQECFRSQGPKNDCCKNKNETKNGIQKSSTLDTVLTSWGKNVPKLWNWIQGSTFFICLLEVYYLAREYVRSELTTKMREYPDHRSRLLCSRQRRIRFYFPKKSYYHLFVKSIFKENNNNRLFFP